MARAGPHAEGGAATLRWRARGLGFIDQVNVSFDQDEHLGNCPGLPLSWPLWAFCRRRGMGTAGSGIGGCSAHDGGPPGERE